MNTVDEELRKEAKARVGFKNHLRTYLVVSIMLFVGWYFLRAQYGYYDGYWPIYPTLGWGFGLVMHYLGVYKNNEAKIDRELLKLKKERGLN